MHTKQKHLLKIALQLGSMTAVALLASFSLGLFSAGDSRPASLIEAGSMSIRGDITGDGELTLEDAISILEISEGYREATPEEVSSDPSGDGVLTVSDALWVLSILAIRS